MKKILSVILMCICALSINAQLLWKISGNGTKEVSYIFGTHHVAPLSIQDSIKGFKQAYQACKQLYGEIPMNDMTPSDIQKIQEITLLPNGQKLNELYTEDEYKKIDEACKKYLGLGLDMLKILKPMAIESQLALAISLKTFDKELKDGQLDSYLQEKAKKEGKDVKGLETIDFQMELMFGLPLEKQAESLLETATSEDIQQQHEKLSKAYMKQNLDDIFTFIKEAEMQDDDEMINLLVYDRNRNWIEQMKTIIPETPTFFVVGAGHLPGEKGVLNLLKKEGFKVEPVW